jgi:predicted nucleic acid-binding protein
MIRTYIDSGVLIASARVLDPIARTCLEFLDDPSREYASSIFIKLELAKAIYYKRQEETDFYENFFNNIVSYWARSLEKITFDAHKEACNYGIAALDSLHIAAAISVGCEEFITTEKVEKPIHRTKSIRVISVYDLV